MKRKLEVLPGFIAFFLIFGGITMALVGIDHEEFGTICRVLLGLECAVLIIILLCIKAYYTPDKPQKKRRKTERYIPIRTNERCWYVSSDTICRAARKTNR